MVKGLLFQNHKPQTLDSLIKAAGTTIPRAARDRASQPIRRVNPKRPELKRFHPRAANCLSLTLPRRMGSTSPPQRATTSLEGRPGRLLGRADEVFGLIRRAKGHSIARRCFSVLRPLTIHLRPHLFHSHLSLCFFFFLSLFPSLSVFLSCPPFLPPPPTKIQRYLLIGLFGFESTGLLTGKHLNTLTHWVPCRCTNNRAPRTPTSQTLYSPNTNSINPKRQAPKLPKLQTPTPKILTTYSPNSVKDDEGKGLSEAQVLSLLGSVQDISPLVPSPSEVVSLSLRRGGGEPITLFTLVAVVQKLLESSSKA